MSAILAASRRRYSRVDTGTYWLATGPGGWVYGVTAGGAWVRSRDGLSQESFGGWGLTQLTRRPVDMCFGGGYAFVIVPATWTDDMIPGGTGVLWRAPEDDFSAWTNVTPGGWVADTCGRNSVLDHNGTTLLVGAYGYWGADGNAAVWRSSDNGANWASWNPGGATRHVHAVHFDPTTPTTAWTTIGDSVGSPRGIYRSTDSGASWSLVASDEYPIDFVWLSDGTILGEGDGIERAHVVGLAPGGSTFTDEITAAMVADGGAAWHGTTRGLTALPGDQIVYTTTAEEGVTGTRWGIWAARPSGGSWDVALLEETDARWMVMGKGIPLSGGRVLCYRHRITVPR